MFPFKVNFVIFVLPYLFSLTPAQKPGLDNAGDILKSLKDAGMIDKFEEDLKRMLFEENERKVKENDKNEEDSVILNSSETKDPFNAFEFIKSYVEEKKIELNEKIILYLMDLDHGNEVHLHLARLTVVLDKIGEISRLKNKSLDAKVIDIVKRIKSLSVMKTSLDKLISDNQTSVPVVPAGPAVPAPKREEEKIEKVVVNRMATGNKKRAGGDNNGPNEITRSITKFLEKVKEDPDQILDIMIPMISSYKLMSSQTLRTVEMYSRMIAETEYFVTFIDIIINYVEDVSETEFGERFSAMVPSLMRAKDMNQIMEVIYKETDLNLNNFLMQIQNSDVRQKLLDAIGNLVASSLTFFDNFFHDDLKMTFVNTFLVSQGFPVINNRKLVSSGFKLMEKLSEAYTSWDVDFRQYEKNVNAHVAEFENNYMVWSNYKSLTSLEQANLISQFLNDHLAQPLELLWLAHNHVTNHVDGPKCAETILCHMNFRMKSTSTGGSGNLKAGVTKALSIFASWAWSLDGRMSNWKLYEAVWKGSNTEDCNIAYAPTGVTTCHIFPWQSRPMSLDFEHLEL